MIALHLVRHGPTAAHGAGAPLGQRDDPVDDDARARWPAVRRALLALEPTLVVTSPLRRAREHAADLGLPLHVDPRLVEQGFGRWEGRPWSGNADAATFLADPVDAVPPGGESFRACARRACEAMRALLATAAAGDRLLVLAHAGPLRAILADRLGLDVAGALRLAWHPFGHSQLDCHDGTAVLVHHNRLPG